MRAEFMNVSNDEVPVPQRGDQTVEGSLHESWSPELVMNVRDDEVSDWSGCLSRMTTKAINTIMTERIWISRVASEIVFQPMYSDTGAPLHEER